MCKNGNCKCKRNSGDSNLSIIDESSDIKLPYKDLAHNSFFTTVGVLCRKVHDSLFMEMISGRLYSPGDTNYLHNIESKVTLVEDIKIKYK